MMPYLTYRKYGGCCACLILGYYLKDILNWIERKQIYMDFYNKIKDILYEKGEKIFPYFFRFLNKYNSINIIEDKFFYKNFDKNVVEKHGKYINIEEINTNSLNTIFKTKILIIGIGGLGSPICFYLSKFGFSEIGLVDGDKVEKSNLHRQIIHKKKNIGLNKTISAKLTLNDFDENTNIVCYPYFLDKKKGLEIIKYYDIIIDCTDNISTRFLINDLCLLYKKKLIFGSALGLYGQLNVYNLNDNDSNCYRCLKNFNNHNEMQNCDENGILSTVTGIIGLLQANEAIKFSANLKEKTLKPFLSYNSFSNNKPFEVINMNYKNKNCICSIYNYNELYNFIINYDYSNISKIGQCTKIDNLNENNYHIDIYNFIDVLNNKFSFFNFIPNYLVILDVRKYNNSNIYGLKNSIKWSYDDIIENVYSASHNNSDNTIYTIFDKLNILEKKGKIVIIVICRRGIDSLKITQLFNNIFLKNGNTSNIPFDKKNIHIQEKDIFVYNMKGGYLELQKKIFKNLPFL
ncbi:ubiquitin-activating enzyme, putative [Plasmodium yoelii]|uniref:Molybdopterin biosynthesis protein MoeB n=3 Tax=Plasmodium yoelii TaxID=5861 RepID=Q7RKQ4_PLAYO|nr:ubiquitin-activating enzyme, putative [Plasmodium yoelii]EAA22342.1 molybdopterin biosynthesis protein MoeB [Plasmodium yoelii yoelii]CDU19113.1 ubiquitin-activating enzyme, putative [Plasmodium yoelii]VTZ79698.1 ubiquitin-activating enzyme, putative [Plasmodium yoelii]|eukprot:XP_730777.1 ubiquitin-activating enzyme, putative [Plasmodium yoelii]